MNAERLTACIVLVLISFIACPIGRAGTITFESVPGAAPADGLVISNQFVSSHGVSFRFENGSFPRLAEVGSPMTAFSGEQYGDDAVAGGQQVGQFFLTDDGVVGAPPPPMIVTYATPVAAASGVLLDIDWDEQWTITAHDGTSNEIGRVTLFDGDPGTGNGIVSPWVFDLAETNIYFIRFSVTDVSGSTGLAFDNFSPASSLVPSDIELGIMTAVELWWNAVPGLFYQVQYSTNLMATNWVNLGPPLEAVADPTYYLDSTRGFAEKHYRVVPGD